MEIDTSLFRISSGEHADVFLCDREKRALKLFRRPPPAQNMIETCCQFCLTRKRFASEVSAYKRISNTTLVANIPTFYGARRITRVVSSGADISINYLLDSCYELELIPGNDTKIRALQGTIACKVNALLQRFHQLGIRFTSDASCFFLPSKEIKLIDFATHANMQTANRLLHLAR